MTKGGDYFEQAPVTTHAIWDDVIVFMGAGDVDKRSPNAEEYARLHPNVAKTRGEQTHNTQYKSSRSAILAACLRMLLDWPIYFAS